MSFNACQGPSTQRDVSSGDRLKLQVQAWNRSPVSAKAAYQSIAISEKAKRTVERLDATDAENLASAAQMAADEDADACTGHLLGHGMPERPSTR